tara:strand:+ start:2260 stop:2433 length:174 start_codon:yes stop_codon:yes gene_type:complete
MDNHERNKLRHEVYTLWYNSKDKNKKQIYGDMLKLIDYTEELRSSIKSVNKLFAGMM